MATLIEAEPSGEASLDAFQRAHLHARRGDLEALALDLWQAQEAGACSPAEALDLRARTLVQQGSLLEAERCWMEALALAPGEPRILQALARLRLRARPHIRLSVYLLIGTMLVLAAGLVGLVGEQERSLAVSRTLVARYEEERVAASQRDELESRRIEALSADVRGLEGGQMRIAEALARNQSGLRRIERSLRHR